VTEAASRLFFPGFLARPHTYDEGLPDGWEALRPPPPRVTHGSLSSLRRWAIGEIAGRSGRSIVAGHSLGAALAVLAALSEPERVEELLLIAPAGLPLTKPVRDSVRELVVQLCTRTYPVSDVSSAALELASAPRAAVRLVRSLRRLDLSEHMRGLRALGIPTTVVGCASDTLVTPAHCRRAAEHLGADYRELELPGGHVWMLYRPSALESVLRDATSTTSATP
jgi:pimeloyl-ACP methyl ester carboxylesterase